MIDKEIKEFNDLLDKLEAMLPYKIPNRSTEEEAEFEKYVSFNTRIEDLKDFFENKADDMTR